VHLQIQKGQPTQILRAFCADFNAYIEPLRDADTACYTPTNSVSTSNHLNGTAVDLNWNTHPFRVLNAGFDGDKLAKMNELVDWYAPVVFWGNRWNEPKDAMHVNLAYNSYNNPRTAEFIRTKIRPDGFSTYKRGEGTKPVPAVLASATAPTTRGGEHVIKWDTSITAQERPWDCGPASLQVALSARGVTKSENELIRLCGTDEGGTDSIDQIRVAASGLGLEYETVWILNDPPRPGQRDQFWADLQATVLSGHAIIMNWVSPASNPPIAIKGSQSPSRLYGRSTIYHYTTAVGFDADARAVLVGDPGVGFAYWITLDNCVSLIAGKGYLRKSGVEAAAAALVSATPQADHGVDVLRDVMGNALPKDRYAALLPALESCLIQCGCTTVDRIAMWCAQIGHESGGLKWMEEIADGSAYEGRNDLGNTEPGDGTRFKGRGPIQVTGRRNYTALSEWAFKAGLVSSPTYFVDRPSELASDKYGFLGVTWYWTTQRKLNEASDAKDIDKATRMINGGLNGIADRRTRYAKAEALGVRLLELVQTPTRQEVTQVGFQSRSPYRTPGEGAIGAVDQFIVSDDGMIHCRFVEESAMELGDTDAIYRVLRSAVGRGADTSDAFVRRARSVLAKIPRDYLSAALVDIEGRDPELLKAVLA
jgi:predicted chitinase